MMACRLFGAKTLSEPMLVCYKLDRQGEILLQFESNYNNFDVQKFLWKCQLQNGDHFVLVP